MQFRVTLVQNFQTFWVDARSERVRVSVSGQEPPLPESAVTAAPPTVTTTAQTSSEQGGEEQDMTDILVGVSTDQSSVTPSEYGYGGSEILGILVYIGGWDKRQKELMCRKGSIAIF